MLGLHTWELELMREPLKAEQSPFTLQLFYLAGKAQSDVALLSWIHNLHLKVVTPGTQRLPSLCKTHINDALPFPYIFQELQREDKTIADRPSGLTLHLLKSPQAAIILSTSSVLMIKRILKA